MDAMDKKFHINFWYVIAAVLLIIGDAQLAPGIARVGILPDHFKEVGDLGIRMASASLEQSGIVFLCLVPFARKLGCHAGIEQSVVDKIAG